MVLVISSVTGLLYGGYDLYDSYLATRLCIRASIQTFFSGVGALDFKATAWLVLRSSKNITELALESGYLASCGRTPPNATCLRLSSDVRDNPQSCIL
jgi:hypothetical protein